MRWRLGLSQTPLGGSQRSSDPLAGREGPSTPNLKSHSSMFAPPTPKSWLRPCVEPIILSRLCIIHEGPETWNTIPNQIRQLNSLVQFKREWKKYANNT